MPDNTSGPDAIAVINTAPDAVDLLKDVLEQAGFLVVTAYIWAVQNGSVNLQALLETYRPKVIVYDIAPPYDRNWAFFLHLRQTILGGYRFVLTSVNVKHVQALVGMDEQVYEVVGKPHDLDVIVRATKEAVRARPTR